MEQRRAGQAGPQGSLALSAFVTAAVSTCPYKTVFLLSSPQLKEVSPDGLFGSTQGFTGLFLPGEAADPASTGPQTHRRIAKPKAFTQVESLPWVFELLVYVEENLFPTLSWEVVGLQTMVSLEHSIEGVTSGGDFHRSQVFRECYKLSEGANPALFGQGRDKGLDSTE